MTEYTSPILEINGTPPKIAGQVCEGFICEGYTFQGKQIATANVTYLKFNGAWFRLYFEYQLVFWRPFDEEPKQWEVPEESWAYPHSDIATQAGILGQKLLAYEILDTLNGSKAIFRFANGCQVLIEDKDDATNYAFI